MDEYEPIPRTVKVIFLIIVSPMILYFGLSFLTAIKVSNSMSQHNYAQRHPVIVQLCLPDKVVKFENVMAHMLDVLPTRNANNTNTLYNYVGTPLSFQGKSNNDYPTVRKWIFDTGHNATLFPELNGEVVQESSSGAGSLGMAAFTLIGNTETNQPVYDYLWHSWVDNLRGLRVITWSDQQAGSFETTLHYWFIPPKNIPDNQFTQWHRPVLLEAEKDRYSQTNSKLMRGTPIATNIEKDATVPMVRYMLAKKNDYLLSHRFPENVRQMISIKAYSNITDEQRSKLAFAPILNEPIPNCVIQKQ